jgi:osmotically-inducible protein OsmY
MDRDRRQRTRRLYGVDWGDRFLYDLALASRVRAELALNPFTSSLEVEASAGAVTLKGSFFEEVEDVQRVAASIPGVTGVTTQELASSEPG